MFHRLSRNTAAHLYGIEFNRVVCLTEGMRNFWDAYEAIDPDAIQHCPKLALQRPPTKGGRNTFDVLTYGSPPNECQLQQLLQSDEPVVYMGGNTYPRWPEVCACARKPEKTKLEWYCRKRTAENVHSHLLTQQHHYQVPKGFFLRYYKPRPALQQYLPPPPQPDIVVHLRLQDGEQDKRQGLDDQSLRALGELLPRNTTYLVTNHVPWYDYFEQQYQWRHPSWNVVLHSAGMGTWGKRGKEGEGDRDMAKQNLQMWVRTRYFLTRVAMRDAMQYASEVVLTNPFSRSLAPLLIHSLLGCFPSLPRRTGILS